MLVTTPITAGAVAYFADGPAGTWLGDGAASLGCSGEVDPAALRRVLRGSSPAGERLVAERPHRRAGWDLTFAAPKGVSLVAALADATLGAALVASHRRAVADALSWLADRVQGGVVACRFDHERSERGDPHLHTHVLVANLRSAEGRWSALGASFWPSLRPAAGVYRSALASHARRAGLGLRWEQVGGGLVDVAGLPPGAVAAASARAAAVQGLLHGLDDPSLAGRAARRAVRGASRRGAPAHGWAVAVAATGLDAALATALLTAEPAAPPVEVAPAAVAWLADRRSSFTGLDAARAVTATGLGLDPREVDATVAALTGERAPYSAGRRYTTGAALGAAARAAADAARSCRVRVGEAAWAEASAQHHLGPAAAAALRHVLCEPGTAVVLPGTPGGEAMLAQAEVLAAARTAWVGAGLDVAIAAPGQASRRWAALTGLEPPRPGRRPDVLLVDRADRVVPAELHPLLDAAVRTGTRVVLVDGGSLPARHHPESSVVDDLAGAAPGGRGPTVPPPPSGLGCVQLGEVVAAMTPTEALGALVARWSAAPPGQRPLLVGLGPAEVRALNAAAQAWRVGTGEAGGPVLVAAGRSYVAGDEVVVLRATNGVAAGTRGVVTAVARGGATLELPGRRLDVDRHDLRRFGLGYAATPGRAQAVAGDLLVLGGLDAVPRLASRAVGGSVVARSATPAPPDRLDLLATVRDAAAVAALVATPLPALRAARARATASCCAGPTPGATDLAARWALGRAVEVRTWALATALEAQPALHRSGRRPGPDQLGPWRAALLADARALDGHPTTELGLGR